MNHNELTSEIPEIICSELNLKENLTEYIRVLNDKYLYLKIEITRNDSPSIHFRIEGDIEDKNILILYNGAYNGTAERKQKPVFQRSSWIKDLKALSINIDDPTILLGNGCIIGWGQGTLEDYYSLYFNNYLQTIYEVLNISALRNKIDTIKYEMDQLIQLTAEWEKEIIGLQQDFQELEKFAQELDEIEKKLR